MRRAGRLTLFLAIMLAAGCAAAKRPYAHDPLLRNGRGVWGNGARGRVHDVQPQPEPDAPRPPAPVELPTLEWEGAKAK